LGVNGYGGGVKKRGWGVNGYGGGVKKRGW